MKLVKLAKKEYEKVMRLPLPKHTLPTKANLFLVELARRLVLDKELKKNPYTLEKLRMEQAGEGPWLILMNHSSVYDIKIVYDILKGEPIAPVVTAEATAGRDILVKLGGGLRAKKYISQQELISDMRYALRRHKANVLMYPEASCSLDGTGLLLQQNMGILFKYLKVPVIMIHARGTFLHTPPFNFPHSRKAPVHITMECLLTPDEIREKTVQELDEILGRAFTYDHFQWQYDNQIEITEPTRAEGLERILYKCPHCLAERRMSSAQSVLRCDACGKEYEMNLLGRMSAVQGETEFAHIPDWFSWQRRQLVQELQENRYCYDMDGEIAVLRDRKAVYRTGPGHLHSDSSGITFTDSRGAIVYHHAPGASYSIACDYKAYYLGDNISCGNQDTQYYFFADKTSGLVKVKLATEELYKLENRNKPERRHPTERRRASGTAAEIVN